MFKGLFFAILSITLLVNLVFLFIAKDKPPDLSSSTFQQRTSFAEKQQSSVGSERILVQRSNREPYYQDYSTQIINTNNHTVQNEQVSIPLIGDGSDNNNNNNKDDKRTKIVNVNKQGDRESFRNQRPGNSSESVGSRFRESIRKHMGEQDVARNVESSSSSSSLSRNTADDDGVNDDSNETNRSVMQVILNDVPKMNLGGNKQKFLNLSMLLGKPESTTRPTESEIKLEKKFFLRKSHQRVSNDDHRDHDGKRGHGGWPQTNEHRDSVMQMNVPLLVTKSTTEKPQRSEVKAWSSSSSVSSNIRFIYNISKQIEDNQEQDKLDKSNNVIYSLGDNDVDRQRTNGVPENRISSEKINKSANDNDANRWLDIRVKSSRSHVFVSVDNIVIYESKSGLSQQAWQQVDASRQAAQYLTRTNILDANNNNIQYNVGPIEDLEPEAGRGIHVIVLNQFNGNVMSKRLYDTYSHNQDKELSHYLNMIQDGRILILAIKDEASFNMATDSPARKLLAKLGSRQIMQLRWRDMWACVLRKITPIETGARLGESSLSLARSHSEMANFGEGLSKSPSFSEWASPVNIEARIKLIDDPDPSMSKCHKSWKSKKKRKEINVADELKQDYHQNVDDLDNVDDKDDDELSRRKEFCAKIEGYGRVCDCSFPSPISFKTRKIKSSQMDQVPIIVMAGNRPYYLQRMLRSLLSADGINPAMILVYIDGFYEEPVLVSQLYNLRAIQHRPEGRRGARISHHYKTSLSKTFELFPEAEFVIIFEEDLDIAQDALLYFNQTMNLLRQDESLYCISAWNDQGYQHTARDPKQLYRIETMPGLGWMLKRDLYERELKPRWPSSERPHDWDMWIRMDSIRKGRECIIPDVSRTFHFGSTGTNINAYFQSLYFSKHSFNLSPLNSNGSERFNGLETMVPVESYDKHLESLIEFGFIITNDNESQNSTEHLCSLTGRNAEMHSRLELRPKQNAIIYIQMIDRKDYGNWLKLANCWKIWDLDARGQHKSTWRLFLNHIPTIVVGYPVSPFSKLKPETVKPFNLVAIK